ncbi:MAG: condensation domain-containing protein [Candidatus Sulfotelmatobacter sp.]
MEFAGSPFLMADKLVPFPRNEEIRRAAVSSFGFGGTNVHVILEEAPASKGAGSSRPLQLFPISAKTPAALKAYTHALAEHLAGALPESFADAAYTFQTGRRQMAHRCFVVAADSLEAARLLDQPNPLRCSSKRCERRDPPVVFLFGGQGTQYVNMGLNLYRDEPLFRGVVDHCCEYLKPHLGRDLRELLYPQSGDEETARISLQDTFFTQPSIFVIEYALARLWQSLGIEPAVMVGHSIGEFVAATLADVWELEDALGIIALRGRLMQDLPRGCMMAVSGSAGSIAQILPTALQIASNNAPNLCVVSGPEADICQFQKQLEETNVVCRRLHTSHAFHSAMMDPIVEPLREAVAKIHLRPPTRPFVSTVTGRPATAAETTDPSYWARHSRATVEFSKAILYLKEQGHDLFLECGPRSTLCSLARQHFPPELPCTAIPTLPDTHENNAEWETLLFALGSLWQNGVTIDWEAFHANEERRHIPLPTYPFERQRYWVDPAVTGASLQAASFVPTTVEASASVSPESVATKSSSASRTDRITSRVLDLLVPLSGRERAQISTSATFMEQGFDSLSLTQVAFAIHKEFSIKISFSQLMKQMPNIEMLVAHLDATLPAEILAEISAAPVPSRGTSSIAAPYEADISSSNRRLDEVVADQARTIARLVTLLEKAGENHSTAAASASSEVSTVVSPPESQSPTNAQASSALIEVESTVPQRGIFASSRLSQHLSASYNESMTMRISGHVSVEKLTRAMQRVFARHDALRASFDEAGLMMKIAPGQQITLPVIDLTSINDPVRQEERLHKMIADETSLPFPVPLGPLFRCQLILLRSDRAAVVFTAHHIICDGWSLDVLIHDLCAFYSEEISGIPAVLEQASSYVDYMRSVNQRHRSDEFSEAARYWRDKFKDGFPVLQLPADHPRGTRREFSSARVDHSFPAPMVKSLKAAAAKQQCSFFVVLLSSLAVLLARVSRQRRFVIALPIAEQPVVGQNNLVGHCIDLVPFVVELRPGEAVSAFVGRIQGELLAAQDNAIFTMISLLEDLHPIVSEPGASAISAGLTHVKKFKPEELPHSGFTMAYDTNPKSYESFEFYLNAVEKEDVLELRCHYDIGLFEDLTIREWLATLESIFRGIIAEPSREVVDLARLKASPITGIDSAQTSTWHTARELPASLAPFAPISPLESSDSLSSSSQAEPTLLRALIVLWQRVLKIRKVRPDDDFFGLGGHSVAAAQLFALIERELGCVAPLASLYEAPTPRMLAGVLSRPRKGHDRQSQAAKNRLDGRSGNFVSRSSVPRFNSEPSPPGSQFESRLNNVACCYIEGTGESQVGSRMLGRADSAIAVHEPEVELSNPPSVLPDKGFVPWPLALSNGDFGVRPFLEKDIAQVADLWWSFLRRAKGPAPPAVLSYFYKLYFADNPWLDSAVPSLVHESKGGRIDGFLGVIRRKMSARGETIRAAFGSNFVVHPEARSGPAGLRLLERYAEGDQDLSLSDSANDASRMLLERLGFQTIVPLSVSWARALRPSAYAVHVISALTRPSLFARLRFAAEPFCSLLDSVGARLRMSLFRQIESPLRASELDAETLLRCLGEFCGGYSLLPEYDLRSLKALLSFMERMHPGAELRKTILRDDGNRILGWYLYYLKPGRVGQVVQIGGERQFAKDVLDHLFYDAWSHGAIGLHGTVQSNRMGEFSEKNCFFTCRSGWTIANSPRHDLLDMLNAGDVFLSRLDGEWCLNFND